MISPRAGVVGCGPRSLLVVLAAASVGACAKLLAIDDVDYAAQPDAGGLDAADAPSERDARDRSLLWRGV